MKVYSLVSQNGTVADNEIFADRLSAIKRGNEIVLKSIKDSNGDHSEYLKIEQNLENDSCWHKFPYEGNNFRLWLKPYAVFLFEVDIAINLQGKQPDKQCQCGKMNDADATVCWNCERNI